jgi:hypothetical protein
MIGRLFVLGCVFFLEGHAAAYVDVTLGLGLTAANPEILLDFSRDRASTPPTKGVTRARASLTAAYYSKAGFGFGLRGEGISISDGEEDTLYTSILLSTSSPLIGFRYNQKDFFMGVLGTYGLRHQGNVTWDKGGSETEASIKDISSYSGAVEVGVIRNSWVLGIEAGYVHAIGKKVEENGVAVQHNGQLVEADLSGLYGAALVGYRFD